MNRNGNPTILKISKFDELYDLLSNILFSSNPIIFNEIADTWMHYYYVILEITACEKKRDLEHFSAERFMNWLPWHEDIFTSFHFYNASQCKEFRNHEFKIGYINFVSPGILHEVNTTQNTAYKNTYKQARIQFLKE